MTDDRSIYELLTATEIALLLAQCPSWTLPWFCTHREARMDEARRLVGAAKWERRVAA